MAAIQYTAQQNAPGQTSAKPIYLGLMGGDYDRLESNLATGGRQAAENAYNTGTQNLTNTMSGRGLYGSSIMQQQQTQGLDREYMRALADNKSKAAATRYGLQQQDLKTGYEGAMQGYGYDRSFDASAANNRTTLENTRMQGENQLTNTALQNSGQLDNTTLLGQNQLSNTGLLNEGNLANTTLQNSGQLANTTLLGQNQLSNTALLNEGNLANTALQNSGQLDNTTLLGQNQLSNTALLNEGNLDNTALQNSGQLANTTLLGQNQLTNTGLLNEGNLANTTLQNSGQLANTTLQGQNQLANTGLLNTGQLANTTLQGQNQLANTGLLNSGQIENTTLQGQNALTVQQSQNEGSAETNATNLQMQQESDANKLAIAKINDVTAQLGITTQAATGLAQIAGQLKAASDKNDQAAITALLSGVGWTVQNWDRVKDTVTDIWGWATE